MLLALALLFFAAHVIAWMVLPASKTRSKHAAAPEFTLRSQPAVAEA